MGLKYIGPKIDDLHLSHELKERIRMAVQVAETKTKYFGISVMEKSYNSAIIAEARWKEFHGFSEVYAYFCGLLWNAFFRSKNTIYTLSLVGSGYREERAEIERALVGAEANKPKDGKKMIDTKVVEPLEVITQATHKKLGTRNERIIHYGRK